MGASMTNVKDLISAELRHLEETKTYKYETALEGPQGGVVQVKGKKLVITGEWARRQIHILDLANQSARQGKSLKARYQ